MAKRRITLTSQEMNEINARTKTLESQLLRSNARVEELESSLTSLKKFVGKKAKPKDLKVFLGEVNGLIETAINPPVVVLAEMAAEAQA